MEITEIISKLIPLRKSGELYVAVCPFHDDKDPSLRIYPQTQTFYCFGCNKYGDAIGFLREYYKNEPEKFEQFVTENNIETRSYREYGKTLNYLKVLVDRYHINLALSSLSYPYERGLTEDEVIKYKIGLGGINFDGIPQEILTRIGLDRDIFINRLTIPFFDVRGTIIGIAGRKLGPGKPLYMNTKFNKQQHFFAPKVIPRHPEKILVVEGYFDAIILSREYNVVATCGTNFSIHHANTLLNFEPRSIYLLFDNDLAGKKAAANTLYMLYKVNGGEKIPDIYIAHPDDDPDVVFLRSGIKDVLNNSTNVIDFIIQQDNAYQKKFAGTLSPQVFKTFINTYSQIMEIPVEKCYAYFYSQGQDRVKKQKENSQDPLLLLIANLGVTQKEFVEIINEANKFFIANQLPEISSADIPLTLAEETDTLLADILNIGNIGYVPRKNLKLITKMFIKEVLKKRKEVFHKNFQSNINGGGDEERKMIDVLNKIISCYNSI